MKCYRLNVPGFMSRSYVYYCMCSTCVTVVATPLQLVFVMITDRSRDRMLLKIGASLLSVVNKVTDQSDVSTIHIEASNLKIMFG